MINIIINAQDKKLEIEGCEPMPLALASHPSWLVNAIKLILDKAYYSGETICLELKDEIGSYHEVERWK